MAKFELEADHILDVEGSFSHHENDSGGATMYGITQGVLSAWRGKKVSVEDVKKLTKEEALKIYKARYWDVNRTSDIRSQLIAKILFDQSVNRGPKTAARILQSACNMVSDKFINPDGVIGNITIAKVNSLPEIELANMFIQTAQDRYIDIVKINKSQLVFLAGWINRTQKLMDAMIRATYSRPTIEGVNKKTPDSDDLDLFSRIVKENPEINKTGLSRALTFFNNPAVKNKKYITFVDFDLPSSKKRMYVINTQTGKADKYKVAHGKYSDPNNDGIADKYSNVVGSGMSSLGAMVLNDPYGYTEKDGWSKFPVAVTIDGLEVGLNDNVRKRAVVFHSSPYVDQWTDFISGRSLGCFAVDDNVAREIQEKVKGGSLLYAYDKDFLGA